MNLACSKKSTMRLVSQLHLFNYCSEEISTTPTQSIPSLFKWTGSKRSQAYRIFLYFPRYKRYFEPFLGSGALLFLAARSNSIAGDIYDPLIKLWQLVKNCPDILIENYKNQWISLQNDLPNYYYCVRNRFNLNPNPFDLNFLLRTCVNGIVRFNNNGEFNNSFHLSRRGMTPNLFEKTVKEWYLRIQNVSFVCQDYKQTIADASGEDFVYFDPPYFCNKCRYISNIDISEFFTSLEILNRKGVKWALSFDGKRGEQDFTYPPPKDLFKRSLLLRSGQSSAGKVLNKSVQQVYESLYLNY